MSERHGVCLFVCVCASRCHVGCLYDICCRSSSIRLSMHIVCSVFYGEYIYIYAVLKSVWHTVLLSFARPPMLSIFPRWVFIFIILRSDCASDTPHSPKWIRKRRKEYVFTVEICCVMGKRRKDEYVLQYSSEPHVNIKSKEGKSKIKTNIFMLRL